MKLYATTTSERASKGQGGNKYIETIITDENKKVIYHVSILPHDEGHMIIEHHGKCAQISKRHGGGYFIRYDLAILHIEQIKGKQKKDDKCAICGKPTDGVSCCIPL